MSYNPRNHSNEYLYKPLFNNLVMANNISCTVALTPSYRWQHDQAQNGRGPDEEPGGENSSEQIEVHVQCVSHNDNNSSHDARDVDSPRDILGVV